MKTVKLTKMNGCGNDFVIVEQEEFDKTGISASEFAKKVCDRNFGVGADGLIIPDTTCKTADIGWDFYNSDGSPAQMCGNGMRCFAKYVFDKKFVQKKQFSVQTLAGIKYPEILANGNVRVNMGKPILEYEKIPFKSDFGKKLSLYGFELNPISMGNPHCVIFTKGDLLEKAKTFGPKIETSEFFPEKTNVEFVEVKSKTEIDFCVWERACGITLACGTGACAATVTGILNNLTENKVTVNLLGGLLSVEWQGSADNTDFDVFLEGSADYNFFAEFVC